MGYQGPFLAILMDDTRIEISEGALDKTIFAAYPEPKSDFISHFKSRYKKSPGIGSDTAYDVVKLYSWAVKKAETFDTKKIQSTLLNAEFSGASGLIKFDQYGGVEKSPILYQVHGKDKVKYQKETEILLRQ